MQSQSFFSIFNLNDPRLGKGENRDLPSNDKEDERQVENDGKASDIDELWNDFNRQLNHLFRFKQVFKEKPSNRNNRPSTPQRGIGIVFLMVLLLAMWLSSGFYIVQEGQTSLVMRFGKYAYTTLAGLHWRLPYPFETNEIVNMMKIRSIEIDGRRIRNDANLKDLSISTADGNIIDIQLSVRYSIKNAVDFAFNNTNAESYVVQVVEASMREIVAKNKMEFILHEGNEKIIKQIMQLVQNILDNHQSGIMINDVKIQNIQIPEEVRATFDDVIKVEQDREIQKNEAQMHLSEVVAHAIGQAAHIIQEAEGYKTKVIAQAKGDADRFSTILNEYNKSPFVMRERMYLDAMQQIFSRTSKILIQSHANNQIIFPLEKLSRVEEPKNISSFHNDIKSPSVSPSKNTSLIESIPQPLALPHERNALRDRAH